MKKLFALQQIVAMVLVLAIAMGILPLGALAASSVDTVYADSEEALQREINAAPDGMDRIIEITQDIYLTKTIQRQGDGSFVLTLFGICDIFLSYRRNSELIDGIYLWPSEAVGQISVLLRERSRTEGTVLLSDRARQ